MHIGGHKEAREALLNRLTALIERGCARWQTSASGQHRTLKNQRPADRREKLKIATFLKEQCDDAAYKFWQTFRKGSTDSNRFTVKSTFAAEAFCERLKRSGFYDDQELETFIDFFKNYFWPIESMWLDGQRRKKELQIRFKEIFPSHIFDGTRVDGQLMFNQCVDSIIHRFDENNYHESRMNADALAHGILNILQEQPNLATPENLYVFQICFNISLSISLSCGTDLTREQASLDYIAGHLFSNAGAYRDAALAIRYPVYKIFRPALIAPLDPLALCYGCLHRVKREVFWREFLINNGESFVDSSGTIVFLKEAIKLRGKLINSGTQIESLTSQEILPLLVSGDSNATNEEADQVIQFLNDPAPFFQTELQSMERGEMLSTPTLSATASLAMSELCLQGDLPSFASASEWLITAKKQLTGSANHLMWSDFYCSVADYMAIRGNGAMEWRALDISKALNFTAGRKTYAHALGERILHRSHAPSIPAPIRANEHETEIIDFLLEMPPSLAGL